MSAPTPSAFGAHRFGQWGYIWHTEDDVAGWIALENKRATDESMHWHGPVALVDVRDLPPQAEREPMTEAEIVKRRGPIYYTTETERRMILAMYTAGVRAAEAHHCIRFKSPRTGAELFLAHIGANP